MTGTQVSGDQIVRDAQRYLGVPYVFGGGPANPQAGLDCSGLVERVAFDLGISSCPRTSEEQFAWGVPVTQPLPGTLVFFVGAPEEAGPPGHVGIVVAAGRMINAPFTGDAVEYDGFSENGTGDAKFMGYRLMQGASSAPGQPTGNNFVDMQAAAAAGGIGGVIGVIVLVVIAAVVLLGAIVTLMIVLR